MLFAIEIELTAEVKEGVFCTCSDQRHSHCNRHTLKQIINETCIYIHVIAI